MAVYKCEVCDTIYDEEKEGVKWDDLPDNWICPVCGSGKSYYKLVQDVATIPDTSDTPGNRDEYCRTPELESYMMDIHKISETGDSIIEPMRTERPTFSWDEILVKGAQLAKIPLNHDEPVNTKTMIGPKAKKPLVIDTHNDRTQKPHDAHPKKTKNTRLHH